MQSYSCAVPHSYLVHKYRKNKTYADARCVFVIHNMGYQGVYPFKPQTISELSLPAEATGTACAAARRRKSKRLFPRLRDMLDTCRRRRPVHSCCS